MAAIKDIAPIKLLILSFMYTLLGALGLMFFEPILGLAQVEDQFTVTQVVTAEISFLTTASDVTMSPSLPGITGGTSNGGTQVVVNTNNAAGYSMTLTSSSTVAMQANATSGEIPNYSTSTGPGVEPDFNFTVPANQAAFGYTVEATTTSDLDPSFLDNGSDTCNTGAADTADSCWVAASSTAYTIVNRTTFTPASGSTTTIKFRVVIQSSPAPAIPQDTYTATTTLTATTN